jgi:short subunit fatty acids transporter
MNADELIGQLVLVHPELTKDPAGKSGQVGIITGTELENDNIYVGFGRNGQGLYGTDALLLLRPAEQLKDLLHEQKQQLSIPDYKAVFQIALLQELIPTTAKIKTAMSLALQSDTVRNLAMRSVEDALGLQRDNYPER